MIEQIIRRIQGIETRIRALELLEKRRHAYAAIYREGNTTEVTVSASSTWYQITTFSSALGAEYNANGDHTTDDITLNDSGVYLVGFSCQVDSIAGAGSHCKIKVFVNNGTTAMTGLIAEHDFAGGAGEEVSMSATGMRPFTAGDTVELWIQNATNTQNYLVEDSFLWILKVS